MDFHFSSPVMKRRARRQAVDLVTRRFVARETLRPSLLFDLKHELTLFLFSIRFRSLLNNTAIRWIGDCHIRRGISRPNAGKDRIRIRNDAYHYFKLIAFERSLVLVLRR